MVFKIKVHNLIIHYVKSIALIDNETINYLKGGDYASEIKLDLVLPKI